MPKDRRTPEEVAEHYRAKTERIALHFKQKAERHALRDNALAKSKEERTTKKLQVKSDAHIKQWKKKLEREEDRRLKSRDDREISRIEVRTAGVEDRKQYERDMKAKKEKQWAHARTVEKRKVLRGAAKARQIEQAKVKNRQRARAILNSQ